MGRGGPKKFRDLLLTTGTEELAHIEMLATAVALNLEGASTAVQEGVAADDPLTQAVLSGMNAKNFLSAGLSAMPVDSDGVPFDVSHVYASGTSRRTCMRTSRPSPPGAPWAPASTS